MAFWFYRGLRRGIVTTRYPKGELDPWTRHLPTAPAFHPDRLTPELAQRLAVGCPAGAITTDGRELVVDLGRCTACGRCLELAGDAAAPSGEHLLAAVERSDLIKRIPMAGR
jgi:ferredoxin